MLRAKDYCNCDHAKYLREKIRKAYVLMHQAEFEEAKHMLWLALRDDSQAELDLWGEEGIA